MLTETISKFQYVKEHLTTNDNGIVTTFEQECVLRLNYQQPIVAKLKYVVWIEEILVFNYGVLNNVVVFFNWVKKIIILEYGFTFGNFKSLIHIFN
jgi:hypothetical protein